MEDVVVGIDLGTTNSCVAAILDGRPKIIEDERGYNILPSCVAFRSKGKFVVGHGAKALILTNPDQTVYAIKRVIGRKFTSPEVQEARSRLSYQIFEGVNDEVLLRLGEVELTPVEISSVIIKCIKEVAERSLNTVVERAVVTVPAYFNHSQRTATMESIQLAGLECIRLINEPTAAALAYGFKKDLDKKIAIYDLGGGTFDISVLEISGGVYETLGTSGNTYLGGEDFDYRIVDYLAEQFHAEHGVDLREDRMSLQRLKDAAERAKCELSFVDKTPVLIPRVHESFNLETTLTRTALEGLVDDLIRETVRITSEAIGEANVAIEELDEIILVGGMTRMPKVQEAIRVFFGMSPCKGVHPEEVVAIGAAVQAYSLEEEGESNLLLDVTPFSLGIDTAGGFFGRVIDRNATIPLQQARTFTTVNDNQEEVKIMVRQGESGVAEENEFLGEFTLQGIRPAPRMVPRVDVTFKIDANGILHVSATDRDTGEKKTVKIRDYIDKAATHETSTDIQLADDDAMISAAKGAAGAAGAAAGGGFLGKLKGLFGRPEEAAPESGSTDVSERGAAAEAAGPVDQSVELQDKDTAAAAAAAVTTASVELQDKDEAQREARAAAEAALSTELQDKDSLTFDPFATDEPPLAMGGADSTDLADREDPGRQQDSGVAAELKASLGALFETDPGDEEAGSVEDEEPTLGDAIEASPFEGDDDMTTAPGQGVPPEQAMMPVDEAAPTDTQGSSLAGDTLDDSPWGKQASDPFAVQERADADPFGASETQDDPFGEEEDGSTADPFSATGMEHSHRVRQVDTQLQTKPDITPATFNLSDDPGALAASKKKPARLKIRYKRPQTFQREFRENLERGGTYIKTPKPLERGRRCAFELTVPGLDEPLKLRGMVVWSSASGDAEGREPGMAIDYDPDDSAGLEGVRRALAELE